jgi:hypothetical protein
LQQGRQSCRVCVEHTERAENNDARPAKVSAGERAEIDERIPDAQLAPDECEETEREQNQQGLHTEEWIAEPIPFLAFTQHDFPGDHREAQQAEAKRVEKRAFFAHGALLGFEVVGIMYDLAAHPQCEQAGGNVDVKDPAPAVVGFLMGRVFVFLPLRSAA